MGSSCSIALIIVIFFTIITFFVIILVEFGGYDGI